MRKRLFRQWNDFKRYNNPWPSGFTGWYSCIDGNNQFNPEMTWIHSRPLTPIPAGANSCRSTTSNQLDWEDLQTLPRLLVPVQTIWLGRALSGWWKVRLALVRISVGESRRYRFSPIGKLDQCKTLCGKIEKGRMATMRSTREIDHLLSHVDEILFPDGKPSRAGTITPAIWAPSSKISKGKFRGPMIYYELRGKFPSSVFAEDGFCWYHSSILFWPNRILLRGLSGCCFRGKSLLWSLQRACASSHPVVHVGLIIHCVCAVHWDLVEPAWLWESWDTK